MKQADENIHELKADIQAFLSIKAIKKEKDRVEKEKKEPNLKSIEYEAYQGCDSIIKLLNNRLFPCPDCKGNISLRAGICPKCGSPVLEKELEAYKQKLCDTSAKDFGKLVEIYKSRKFWSKVQDWLLIIAIICCLLFIAEQWAIIQRGWR